MPFKEELLQKREEIKALGLNPYPYEFKTSHTLVDLAANKEEWLEKDVRVAGRITALRQQGKKVFFADIEDFDGRIQVYLKQKEVGEEVWPLIKLLDIGDWIGIEGQVFLTRTEELTVLSKKLEVLSKAVVRVPISKSKGEESYYQLSDPETLARQRYLQWITDKKSRQIVLKRARIISEIRRFMEDRGFLEVTTPTVEIMYGGASACPFETSIKALSNQKAYLRISPELPLKKFIVGGFPKVYTICQNFRNEGIDRSHNPEFTMMEWYEAFTDYNYQMEQYEELVSTVIEKINGSTKVTYQGEELDFTTPWRRLTMIDALKELGNIDISALSDEEIIGKAKEVDVKKTLGEGCSRGHAMNFLFEELCEEKLIQPTFILDHPVEISPLTKIHRELPGHVERFEPFVMGMEIGNAYSELTDPVEQYDRLKGQRQYDDQSIKDEGVAHHPLDMDFVNAIAMGMPPTGGVGLGVDRLIMLMTDSATIRDVIPFPMIRQKESSSSTEEKKDSENTNAEAES